jgi:hypothetical protein
MGVYIRAMRLPFLTGSLMPAAPAFAVRAVHQPGAHPPTDEEFVAFQALTIRTHFLLGVSLTLAFLYAAWRQ